MWRARFSPNPKLDPVEPANRACYGNAVLADGAQIAGRLSIKTPLEIM